MLSDADRKKAADILIAAEKERAIDELRSQVADLALQADESGARHLRSRHPSDHIA